MFEEKTILKNLKEKRKALEAELTKVNRAILALEPMPVEFMRWKEKALDCIKGFKCYCQTTDILECVFTDSEEMLEDAVFRRRHLTALSVALGEMVKTGKLKTFKLYRTKGNFYGFPQWFNSNGTLNKKYYSDKMRLLNTDANDWIIKNSKEAAQTKL